MSLLGNLKPSPWRREGRDGAHNPVCGPAGLLLQTRQERPARLGDAGRLPLLHPEGLREFTGAGPADPLRRLVKQRSSIVKRRTAVLTCIEALPDLPGPAWLVVLSGHYGKAALMLLSRWRPERAAASRPGTSDSIPDPTLPRRLARRSRRAAARRRAGIAATLARYGHRLCRTRRRHRRRSRTSPSTHRTDRGSRRAHRQPLRPRRPERHYRLRTRLWPDPVPDRRRSPG